jgi:bifunctional UDP-N-acetylglucosamine pyrophosphorylase/glucosamine-1-phosphate N-acetyltransferase
MRSSLPKVLHPVAGLPMVTHVLRAAAVVDPVATILVVSPELSDLPQRLDAADSVSAAVQERPLGTGDAVRCALPSLEAVAPDLLLVFFADHPRLDPDTVRALRDGAVASGALVTVLAARVDDAAGYGRVDRDAAGNPIRIVERRDDDPTRRGGPTEINSGMMALDAAWARNVLPALQPSPVSGEVYLTELVERSVAAGPLPTGAWPVAVVHADARVALGINDRVELAAADADIRATIRERLMRSGVSMVGPETIFIDAGVEIGPDTTILPFSVLSGQTVVGADCRIGPYSVLDDATIGDGARVTASFVSGSSMGTGSDAGPYARLRGGTRLGPGVHVGNFAELKNAELGEDVRCGHFSYLGDVEIGSGSNIGAGTITANYDGINKHRTTIGEDAFIGSDTILRAPVTVGSGARTGAGSVVTKDVPPGATVVGVPARQIRSGGAAGSGREGS